MTFVSMAQTSVTCHKCESRTKIRCNSCVIAGSTFTGLIVKRNNKPDVALFHPVQVKNRDKQFELQDFYGTKVQLDISEMAVNNTIKGFYDFISSCNCETVEQASYGSLSRSLATELEDEVPDFFYVTGSNTKKMNLNNTISVGAVTAIGDSILRVSEMGYYRVTFSMNTLVSPASFVYCKVMKNSTPMTELGDNITHVTNDFGTYYFNKVLLLQPNDEISVVMYKLGGSVTLTVNDAALIVEKLRTP